MRSRWTSIVVGALAVTLVSGSVLAMNQYRSRPLDRQNLGVIAGAHTVRSTDFAVLGGWGPSDSMHVRARGGIAATLSATVTGGPVEFRMFLEDVQHGWATRTMRPSAAAFDPGTGTVSGSFTFVAAVPAGDYTVNISWRSPTGAQVTMTNGSLVVQYGAA